MSLVISVLVLIVLLILATALHYQIGFHFTFFLLLILYEAFSEILFLKNYLLLPRWASCITFIILEVFQGTHLFVKYVIKTLWPYQINRKTSRPPSWTNRYLCKNPNTIFVSKTIPNKAKNKHRHFSNITNRSNVPSNLLHKVSGNKGSPHLHINRKPCDIGECKNAASHEDRNGKSIVVNDLW